MPSNNSVKKGGRSSAALLFVCALALSAFASGCGSSGSKSSDAAPAATVDVALQDFMIMPSPIDTKAGSVKFHVHNDGKTPHNFYIRQNGDIVGHSKDLNPGEQEDFTVALKTGKYDGFCAEPGHESLGMLVAVNVS